MVDRHEKKLEESETETRKKKRERDGQCVQKKP